MTVAEVLDDTKEDHSQNNSTGGEVRDGADAECHVEYAAGDDFGQG